METIGQDVLPYVMRTQQEVVECTTINFLYKISRGTEGHHHQYVIAELTQPSEQHHVVTTVVTYRPNSSIQQIYKNNKSGHK